MSGLKPANETFTLMHASYRVKFHKPYVNLVSRDINRKQVIWELPGVPPYFYAPKQAPMQIRDYLGRKVAKVVAELPRDIKQLRRYYEFTNEGKILYPQRCLIDWKLFDTFKVVDKVPIPVEADFYIPPRYGQFDIEIESPPEIIPKPKNPIYPIISFAVRDTYTGKLLVILLKNEAVVDAYPGGVVVNELTEEIFEKYEIIIVYKETESDLFGEIASVIHHIKFDAMEGWYSNQYDWPYLYYRAKRIGFNPWRLSPLGFFEVNFSELSQRYSLRMHGMECVDLHTWYKTYTKPEGEKQSFNLKFIVKLETDGRFEYEDLGDQIEYYHNNKHKELIDYCIDDIRALEEVDKARNLNYYYDQVRRRVGCPLSVAHVRGALAKIGLLRLSEVPLPTQVYRKKVPYPGAVVDCLVPGLHENVATFDVGTMYPILMLGLNASPETKSPNGDIVAPNGTRFLSKPKGLLPRAVEIEIKEKQAIDAQLALIMTSDPMYAKLQTQRETTKYTLNAKYGYPAFPGSIVFDPEVSAAVTSAGRLVLKEMTLFVDSLPGYRVLYRDTDSVHVKMKSSDWHEAIKFERLLKNFLKAVSKNMDLLVPLDIKFENWFERVLYHTKKRYVGWCTVRKGKSYNKLMIYGLSAKRSDSSPLTRKLQEKFFEAVIKRGDVREGIAWIKRALRDFQKLPLNYIGVPKGLSRPAETYEHFAWAEGVKYSTKVLKMRFREDRKPRLIYGHIKGKLKTDKFCVREDTTFIPDAVVNYSKMINVTIRKKFEPLLKDVGADWTSVTELVPTKQSKLEKFA